MHHINSQSQPNIKKQEHDSITLTNKKAASKVRTYKKENDWNEPLNKIAGEKARII